jgi:hypothetical protein
MVLREAMKIQPCGAALIKLWVRPKDDLPSYFVAAL